MDTTEHCVVLCTCPEGVHAETLATALVEQKLAACVNLVPGIHSIYRWQGAVERATEVLLIIKTRRERLEALEAGIRALHPYQVPEIVALPVTAGFVPYLQWLNESL
ncbi:MAG: divalent-cation tolerance protein CutA [Gammaproteobacteria bacterium]|nr:divalent-cation tolerance protein CutA [Gammaproteobacteria bacterium]